MVNSIFEGMQCSIFLRCDTGHDTLMVEQSLVQAYLYIFGMDCWLTMIEKEAPKLCNRLHSRPSSCVYPSSARRPSSWILKLTSEEGISGSARCSGENWSVSARGRTGREVRLKTKDRTYSVFAFRSRYHIILGSQQPAMGGLDCAVRVKGRGEEEI